MTMAAENPQRASERQPSKAERADEAADAAKLPLEAAAATMVAATIATTTTTSEPTATTTMTTTVPTRQKKPTTTTTTTQSYLEEEEEKKSTNLKSKFCPKLNSMTAIRAEVRRRQAPVVAGAEAMAKAMRAGARKRQKVAVRWISGTTRLG